MKKDILRYGLTAFLLTFSFSILLQGTYYFNKGIYASLVVQEEDEEEEEDNLNDDLLQDARDEFKNIQKKLKFRDRQISSIKGNSSGIADAQDMLGLLKEESGRLNEALQKADSETFFDLKSDFDEKDSELEDLIEEIIKGDTSKKIQAFIVYRKQQLKEMQKILEDFQNAQNENDNDEEDEDAQEQKEILKESGKIIQNFDDAINALQEEFEESENDAQSLEILADDLQNRTPAFEDLVQKFGKLTGQAAQFRRLEKKMEKQEQIEKIEKVKKPNKAKKPLKNESGKKLTPEKNIPKIRDSIKKVPYRKNYRPPKQTPKQKKIRS